MSEKPRNRIEVHSGTQVVDMWYPDQDENGLSDVTIDIGLYHTRAASDISIKYDFKRDGYVVYMDKTIERDDHMETLQEMCEVAFIPSWNEVRE